MNKLIKINDADVIPLKVLAAKAGKDLKNYIKDVLAEHTKPKEPAPHPQKINVKMLISDLESVLDDYNTDEAMSKLEETITELKKLRQ